MAVTPFSGAGVDERSFAELAAWQVDAGSSGLCVAGPAGEAPTLTARERERLIAIARESAGGRAVIIAGLCTSSTEAGIALARSAAAAGADAVLVQAPPYSRPAQEGICRHIEAIAHATDCAVLVQDDPGRTRVDLTPSSIERLSRLDRVVGFVDACRAAASPPARGKLGFTARDEQAAPFLLAGGSGILSVAANVVPGLCAALHRACREGRGGEAMRLQHRLLPLVDAIGPDGDPAPVKYALFLLRSGFSPDLRLPLVRCCAERARRIAEALEILKEEVSWA